MKKYELMLLHYTRLCWQYSLLKCISTIELSLLIKVWCISQPFHMSRCIGVHERNQHHFVIKDITVFKRLLHGNNICDTSLCDAIANIYGEMVLKIFINTIAKPHVKSLSDLNVQAQMNKMGAC